MAQHLVYLCNVGRCKMCKLKQFKQMVVTKKLQSLQRSVDSICIPSNNYIAVAATTAKVLL